jgi:hypothetical protein
MLQSITSHEKVSRAPCARREGVEVWAQIQAQAYASHHQIWIVAADGFDKYHARMGKQHEFIYSGL